MKRFPQVGSYNDQGKGYRELVLSISQSGTDAPLISTLEDTSSLNLNITSLRQGVGIYFLNISTTDVTLFSKLYADISLSSDGASSLMPIVTTKKIDSISASSTLSVVLLSNDSSSSTPTDDAFKDALLTIKIRDL